MYAYLLLPSVLQSTNLGTVYQPNLKQKSDADIMRDAKLEAMGLRPDDHEPPKHKQNPTATDDMVSGSGARHKFLLTFRFR
jgi:hypothetical protein